MSMTRRGLLGAALAAFAAPAIVRADALMRIVPPRPPTLWGDGIHDDTEALNYWLNRGGFVLSGGVYFISDTLRIRRDGFTIHDTRLIAGPALLEKMDAGGYMIHLDGCHGGSICHTSFDTSSHRPLNVGHSGVVFGIAAPNDGHGNFRDPVRDASWAN